MGNTCRVGNIRPSQLLWTYGPGAMIDLPNFSVMTMGLDSWKQDQCHLIEEPRLLEQVRKMCGAQVERMLQPPVCETELDNPNDPHSYIGVPVQPFPRWFRCVKCGMMAEYDSGLFDIKENFYRSERTRFVHANCPKGHGKPVDAVPVRFLVACKHGHVDDFPWRWFVHDGPSECQGALYFYEKGASLQTENLWVECKGCGKRKSLAKAFGQIGQETLPACRGHHPHLGYDADSFSECKEKLRPILLGATNSWFPVTVSVLAIPTRENELAQLVADNWSVLNVITSVEMLTMAFTMWQAQGLLVELRSYGVNDVWAAIEKERKPKKAEEVTDEDIKVPEWNELISEKPIGKFPFFVCKKGVVPDAFKNEIRKVVLLERLRKVNALVGFTRIEARDEFADDVAKPSGLCKGPPKFVPACEGFGEGLFLQFDESVIAQWETLPAVKKQETELRKAYAGWRANRGLDPSKGFPGARFYMLHTIAHLFIRELALECGYNAASIQERIYAKAGEKPMAGILIYTAASDSDGTLGGLVGLGAPEKLGVILKKALVRAETCSSDPLCSDHKNKADWSLHGAACHACAFAAETSCEVGNRYLDRSLVVPTYAVKDAAFFKGVGE